MHELPKLPYTFDSLEPFIDAQTMEIHYSKHHQAYVNNLNAIIEKNPDLKEKSVEDLLKNVQKLPEDIRQGVINNAGGHLNHTFFWHTLGLNGPKEPSGELKEAINDVFGGFDNFKTQFSEAATKRFGSGWAWLTIDSNGKLEIWSTPNQDSPIMVGKRPVLGLDVWEHAYYLKYQNRRPEYIQAFWNVINWDEVNKHFIRKDY
jgi:superoxide dismutase, Fe-Mn family